MNILIVRTSCRGANTGSVSYNWQEIGLARALCRRGHQCDVVFFGGSKKETIRIPISDQGHGKSINLFFLRGLPLYDAAVFFGLTRLVDKYDIVQVAEYDQIESWRLAKRFPEKVVVYHGPYYSKFNSRYNLKCKVFDTFCLQAYIENGTPFITKSEKASVFLKEKGIHNINTIGVGFDIDQMREIKTIDSKSIVSHVRLLRSDGWKILLYIGRIEPRRNPYLLLDILSELRQADKKVHLVVVGKGVPEYVDSWLDLARERGVASDISYAPVLSQGELPDIYRSSDLFILPSSYEIFGMVLLESMYFGVPAVTTKNGGSLTLIKDGTNGFIVNSFDYKEWVNMISYVLSNDDSLTSVRNAAMRTIRESFTWDALAPRFIEAYRKLLYCSQGSSHSTPKKINN